MTSTLPKINGPSHEFFKFEAQRSDRVIVRQVALQLANYYFQADRSRTQWAAIRQKLVCSWERMEKTGDQGQTHWVRYDSNPIHLKDIEAELFKTGTFDYESKRLPQPTCLWLDSHTPFSMNFHHSDGTGSVAMRVATSIGPRFPLRPMIDREGTVINSFQPILLERISNTRTWLVEHSQDPSSPEWFQMFRTLVTECISFVDNTLHQLYFKAQYDPAPSWKFDAAALGERHGRKLADKLAWVHRITGQHLDAHVEVKSMHMIRELRNHLQHFDPPCFAYTLEEATTWLNQVSDIARLGWRIRRCASALPSVELIRLMLQPKVLFVPNEISKKRVPQPKDVGYSSSNAQALAKAAPHRQSQAIVDLHSHAGVSRILGGGS
jgi:hypothetical protein